MDASVILRFANRSTSRLRNIRVLIDHIKRRDNLEIIISAMDKDLTDIKKAKKKFTPGTFESSRANNIGAAMASTNILIFQDADIIFGLKAYDQVIQKIKDGLEMVRVGEKCVNLNAQSAKRMVGNLAHVDRTLSKKFKSGMRDAPGACIAIGKKAFTKIGGYCELFKVYGWEDCYFRYKANKLTKHTCLHKQMIHLPHEINFQMKHQAKNADLYSAAIYTDGGNCKRLARRDRKALYKRYPGLFK